MFPTHKDCRNFRDGVCVLLGVQVNPDGPACPKFTPKDLTLPLYKPSRGVESGVSVAELRRRLERLEAKLREVRSMLNRVK